MPHIVVEYDKKVKTLIDLSKLARTLHYTLADHDTVSLEAIKTRTIEVGNLLIADSCETSIIHIEVKLLPGRSSDLKSLMAESLFKEAKKVVNDILCSVTVNISDLGVYKK